MSFINAILFNSRILSGEDEDLSKYILQAEFDGRLKSNEGGLSATGDLATLTAASGKDLYLTAAKVVFFGNVSSVIAIADEIVLKVNGTIVETTKSSLAGQTTSSGSTTFAYEFKNIGHSVAATQVLKLEVITLDTQTDVEGFIQAIEVPTGENPVTYAGA